MLHITKAHRVMGTGWVEWAESEYCDSIPRGLE